MAGSSVQRVTVDGTRDAAFGPQGLDEAALLRLLALAGPTDGRELIRRLITDLDEVAAGLNAGLAQRDRAALRKHSHVLLAIAGTIGAEQIYRQAQDLNQCAKDDRRTEAEPLAAEVLPRLVALTQRLRAVSVELGMGG